MSNYPDGLSESTTDAPWAPGHEPDFVCNTCERKPEDPGAVDVGDECEWWYNREGNLVNPPSDGRQTRNQQRCDGTLYDTKDSQ